MTNGSPPAPEKQPMWKRLLPTVLGLGIVVFLFGWVLPQFIDYDAVFRAIGRISPFEWVLLLLVAAVRFAPEGWIYVAAQPGLNTGQGMQLFLVAETLSNVPPGGLDLISRFQMTRSWGFSAASSTSATIASWVFSSLSKLVLPIFAVLFLAVREIQEDDLDFLALLALVIVGVGTVAVALILRSPKLATWAGDLLGTIVGRVAGIFRKEVKTNFRDLVHEFRDQASDVLRSRTHLGLAAGLAARAASFVVLLLAVRFVDIPGSEVHWTVIFAAFSIVMAITVIPIFNLPGITELILISTLSRYAGDGFADEIAAAVFVYRLLTWLLPIPFGGVAYTRWRDNVRGTTGQGPLDAIDMSSDEPT
ncbi:MAG: lysylphosphatidylglycerol synthase domain-containing protein [Acidimicrobiia bacterium]